MKGKAVTESRQIKERRPGPCETALPAEQVERIPPAIGKDSSEIPFPAVPAAHDPLAPQSETIHREQLVCLAALVGEAAAAAVLTPSGSDLAEFADRVLKIENLAQNSADYRGLEQPIRAMYRRLLDLSRNELLTKLSLPIEKAIWNDASRNDAVDIGELREAHRLLLNAFATGNPDGARRAVRKGLVAVLGAEEALHSEPGQ